MRKSNKKFKDKGHRTHEIREDLQDGERGKDLSCLNEMPQMGGYEGVKAGVPPPDNTQSEELKSKED